mgnify:CR=1 FL=1
MPKTGQSHAAPLRRTGLARCGPFRRRADFNLTRSFEIRFIPTYL